MKTIISTLSLALIFLSSCSSSNIKQPEYRAIREVKLVDVGLLSSTAGVDLVYFNPNSFGLTLDNASGDVYLDNHFLGRFELGDKVAIKKNAEFVVPALIKIDMIGALKNQREIFSKKEALLRLDGFATVKKAGFSKQVPIKYEQMQNIEKLRSAVSL